MNFRCLVEGLDPGPVLAELEARPDLWKLITFRQEYEGSAHKDSETIVLRGPTSGEDLLENLTLMEFPYLPELPATVAYLQAVIAEVAMVHVGRVMAVRLKAGGCVTPHVDEGRYARYWARFHAPLSTNTGCRFQCGEESVHMAAGSVWWFNHQRLHSVVNEGGERVHLIVDAGVPGFTGALA